MHLHPRSNTSSSVSVAAAVCGGVALCDGKIVVSLAWRCVVCSKMHAGLHLSLWVSVQSRSRSGLPHIRLDSLFAELRALAVGNNKQNLGLKEKEYFVFKFVNILSVACCSEMVRSLLMTTKQLDNDKKCRRS